MPIGWMKDNRRNIKFFFIAAIRYSSDKACAGKLFNQLQRQESSNVLDRGIEGRCFFESLRDFIGSSGCVAGR